MANPRESRAEIQRILEDFTRGTIDFQSLLNELDETFQVDASARTVALELVEQLHPNGALQRGFFRVLKDRIEQNLATGAPIPIVSHPRSAHAVDAVLQKDLPLDDRTVPLGRAGTETDAEDGAGSADEPIRGDEAVSAALAADTTVPLRAPTEPIETPTEPVSVAPEPIAPPLESAASSTPSPGTSEPAPSPVPPPGAEAHPADVAPPGTAERAKARTREPVVGPWPARERPFVTERRDMPPPKRNALNWIGGIIVIGLMATLVLFGPLRDYLPQIKAYAVNVQQEIAALFATQEPPAPPSANEAAPPVSATTPTTQPATTESTPSPQSMESAPAATATETPGAAARAGDATTGEQQAAPSVASSSAQPQTPTAAPVPTPPSTTTVQPETPTPTRSVTSDVATAAPAAKPSVAAVPPRPGRFTFASRSYRVREDAGMIALRIERRDGSAGAASVSWWTIPDTASAEEDYADFGARVEAFADGETTRTIYVPITSDDIAEDEETFEVQLGEPAGASLGATATATVTILDDDL